MTTFTLTRNEVRELVPHLAHVAIYAGDCALEDDREPLDNLDRLIGLMNAFLKEEERVEA